MVSTQLFVMNLENAVSRFRSFFNKNCHLQICTLCTTIICLRYNKIQQQIERTVFMFTVAAALRANSERHQRVRTNIPIKETCAAHNVFHTATMFLECWKRYSVFFFNSESSNVLMLCLQLNYCYVSTVFQLQVLNKINNSQK